MLFLFVLVSRGTGYWMALCMDYKALQGGVIKKLEFWTIDVALRGLLHTNKF